MPETRMCCICGDKMGAESGKVCSGCAYPIVEEGIPVFVRPHMPRPYLDPDGNFDIRHLTPQEVKDELKKWNAFANTLNTRAYAGCSLADFLTHGLACHVAGCDVDADAPVPCTLEPI